MSDFQYHLNAALGPSLGFLFTAATMLFIALNAKRKKPVPPQSANTPPEALG